MNKLFLILLSIIAAAGCQVREKTEVIKVAEDPTAQQDTKQGGDSSSDEQQSSPDRNHNSEAEGVQADPGWVSAQKILNNDQMTIEAKRILLAQVINDIGSRHKVDSKTIALVAEKVLQLNSILDQTNKSQDQLAKIAKIRNRVSVRNGIMNYSKDKKIDLLTDSASFREHSVEGYYERTLAKVHYQNIAMAEKMVFDTIQSYNKVTTQRLVSELNARRGITEEQFKQQFANLDEKMVEMMADKIAKETISEIRNLHPELDTPVALMTIAESVKDLVIQDLRLEPGALSFQLNNSDIKEMARNLGSGVKAISLFAGKKSDLGQELAKHASELIQFSKDGRVKIESEFLKNPDKLKKHLAETNDRLSEFSAGAQLLTGLVKEANMDPSLIKACEDVTNFATKANAVIGAIVQPTPMNVVSAISSVFGSGSPAANAEAQRHSRIMSKLAELQKLQQQTLSEVIEARKDIFTLRQEMMEAHRETMKQFYLVQNGLYDIQQQNLMTQAMLGEISEQISAVARILSEQISQVQTSNKLNTEILKSIMSTKYASCFAVNNEHSIGYLSTFQVPSSVKGLLKDCNESLSRLNLDTEETMNSFIDSDIAVDHEVLSFYDKSVKSISSSLIALNPLTYASYFQQNHLIQDPDHLHVKRESKILRQEFVIDYANSVQKMYPYLLFFEQDENLQKDKIVNSSSMFSGQVRLGQLMKMIQTSIYQQVILSGATSGQLQANDFGNSRYLDLPKKNYLLGYIHDTLKFAGVGSEYYEYAYELATKPFIGSDRKYEFEVGQFADLFWKFKPVFDSSQPIKSQLFSIEVLFPKPDEVRNGFFEYREGTMTLLKIRESLVDLLTDLDIAKSSDPELRKFIRTMVFQSALN